MNFSIDIQHDFSQWGERERGALGMMAMNMHDLPFWNVYFFFF